MQLKGAEVRIQAEYLFFCAYLQRGDEGELERVNGMFFLCLGLYLIWRTLANRTKTKGICSATC